MDLRSCPKVEKQHFDGSASVERALDPFDHPGRAHEQRVLAHPDHGIARLDETLDAGLVSVVGDRVGAVTLAIVLDHHLHVAEVQVREPQSLASPVADLPLQLGFAEACAYQQQSQQRLGT